LIELALISLISDELRKCPSSRGCCGCRNFPSDYGGVDSPRICCRGCGSSVSSVLEALVHEVVRIEKLARRILRKTKSSLGKDI